MKDQRPLRQFEPVAFFEFDNSQEITFSLDFNRPAKYIMLLPTGFRKKPDKLGQRPDMVPMEIQFFGVQGSSAEVTHLNTVETDDGVSNIEVASEYDIEIRTLDTDVLLKEVKNFKIDQLKVKDFSLSPQTILDLPRNISESIKFEGVSSIKIADSSLQL